MANQIVAYRVRDKKEGRDVYDMLENREEEGRLSVTEAALVYRTEHGHNRVHYYGQHPVARGAIAGGAVGVVGAVGVLTGLLPAFLGIGLIPGGVVGGMIGKWWDSHFMGKDALKDFADHLENGGAFVLVVTDEAGADYLQSDTKYATTRLEVTESALADAAAIAEGAAQQ